jgi:hypothetical protein
MEFRDIASKELAEVADRLTKAAEQASASVKHAAEAAAKHAAEEARKTQDALRSELLAQVNEKKSIAASLKDTQTKYDVLRQDLDAANKRADAETKRADAETKRADGLAAELGKTSEAVSNLERELQETCKALEGARAEAVALRQTIDAVVSEKVLAEEATTAAQSQAQAAEAQLTAVTDLLKANAAKVKALERTQQDLERTVRELQSKKGGAPAAPAPAADGLRASVSLFEELLGAFQALSSATSVSDVLSTMMEHLATEFSRVALFRVKSNHLQGEHQIGFDTNTDISKVMIPLGMDSVLTRATGSGVIERLSAAELADSSRAPFSGTATCAIALPVVVNDETLAVVYADDSGASSGDKRADATHLRVQFADAVLQHSIALLTRMKDELKKLADLRAYAASLLKEIEAMYVADADGGKPDADLRDRLKMNLDYARSMFSNRVALEEVDAAGAFDDVVDAAVGAHPATAFTRALADACGHEASAARHAAEAS